MMDAHYLQNIAKAAERGAAEYCSADDWHQAILSVAKANRQKGETPEQAEARLTLHDPIVKRMDQMRRRALAQADVRKAGRPRIYNPQGVTVTKAESALFELAKVCAQRDSMTFEQGFVAVLDTPQGAALYQQVRGAV